MKRNRLLIPLLALSIAAATGIAAFGKPLRLAAPDLFGLHCAGRVCVETPDQLDAALALVGAARANVEDMVQGPLPTLSMVLCNTPVCYMRFGGGTERAISFPFLGTVVAGPDWQDYIIRHELVHWLQFERYGALETMSHPDWFREGMAYALSGAPDWDIPVQYRPSIRQFTAWREDRPAADILRERPSFADGR